MDSLPAAYSFLVVFLAELGDKTQLLTLGFAAKYPFWEVMAAVSLATAGLMAMAVLFGGLINYYIPTFYVQLFAGLLFLYFGVKTLLTDDGCNCQAEMAKTRQRQGFWLVLTAFLLAEMGDKTQLATFALTAKYGSPIFVWLGATLGMVGANLLGGVVGKILKDKLSDEVIKWLGGLVFLIFGLWTLGELFIW
ncbi:hypothetical protein A2311_04465 [candidate division WOR-1 bacterium RIFOXYB2_FULL_48_7]|uniref:GDT1 family protein n=1 Tax=candidate division WOR-1 bacterium RIFOXYB2_FULL_48_7 TaxID=1802583 RepID=A0A1F4TJ42_UNCSA|nr:MAG: hypothetical protein A2311_04465 [candidate division WOR-1 bacterium RIFOXYB2_FULL_48_7]